MLTNLKAPLTTCWPFRLLVSEVLYPLWPYCDQCWCDICFSGKDYDNAIKYYSEALELNPSNAIYYSNRSLAYLRTECYGYALADATKALEIDKNYIKGYYRRATSNMALGKFKAALKDYETVRKMDLSLYLATHIPLPWILLLFSSDIPEPWWNYVSNPPHRKNKLAVSSVCCPWERPAPSVGLSSWVRIFMEPKRPRTRIIL